MSDYASAAERARRAFASVARLEAALARAPDDASLQINLASRMKLARQTQQQLAWAAEQCQVEVCNYRLLPESSDRYYLPYVTKSLAEYQNVFSQVYDALENGPKMRAVIGKEAARASMMELGYTYSGSLGVVLMAPSERSLFEGKLDKPIEALFQVLDISSQDDVRDIARTLGEAVIKRVHDWSKSNVDGGFAVDVRWNRSDGRQLGQVVVQKQMELIVDIIEATSDEKTRNLTVSGTLVGLNVQAGTFQLSAPDDVGDYRGSLADDFVRDQAHSVPGAYRAGLIEVKKVVYATNREEKRYQLKRLDPEHPA